MLLTKVKKKMLLTLDGFTASLANITLKIRHCGFSTTDLTTTELNSVYKAS